MLRISRTERRLREFWSGHRATVGVAASVAVMAVFATLLGLECGAPPRPSRSLSGYKVLRREMNNLKKNQKALNAPSTALAARLPPPAPISKFSGTGFALTAEGYLVTSYHVIQGADSLLIEGRTASATTPRRCILT